MKQTDIEEHEDYYLHIRKKILYISIYGIASLWSWGYIIYRYSEYDNVGTGAIIPAFIIMFFAVVIPFCIMLFKE